MTTDSGSGAGFASAGVRVIKLGGRAQSAHALPSLIARAWQQPEASSRSGFPGQLCVVHGGGDEISTLQRVFGGEPKFAGGRRVTTESDLAVIRMVLSGVVNKRLVAAFSAAGVPSVGLSGEDGGLVSANPLGIDEFGFVGIPGAIDTSVIELLWKGNFLPVVSPVATNGSDASRGAMNVNGDDSAAALAVALHATELLLVADVPGVLDASGTLIPQLSVADARALIAQGVAVGGMAAKLEAAYAALAGGVAHVRIASLDGITDLECGTVIVPAVAPAEAADTLVEAGAA